jgi:hypothetical protein
MDKQLEFTLKLLGWHKGRVFNGVSYIPGKSTDLLINSTYLVYYPNENRYVYRPSNNKFPIIITNNPKDIIKTISNV